MTLRHASEENARRVRSTNWMWALGALAVWVGIFFAFLLIAIARP
jgi:hypothetical protein